MGNSNTGDVKKLGSHRICFLIHHLGVLLHRCSTKRRQNNELNLSMESTNCSGWCTAKSSTVEASFCATHTNVRHYTTSSSLDLPTGSWISGLPLLCEPRKAPSENIGEHSVAVCVAVASKRCRSNGGASFRNSSSLTSNPVNGCVPMTLASTGWMLSTSISATSLSTLLPEDDVHDRCVLKSCCLVFSYIPPMSFVARCSRAHTSIMASMSTGRFGNGCFMSMG